MARKDSNEKVIEAFDLTMTMRSKTPHIEIGIRKWKRLQISFGEIDRCRSIAFHYMSKMMNTDVYLLLLHDTNLA